VTELQIRGVTGIDASMKWNELYKLMKEHEGNKRVASSQCRISSRSSISTRDKLSVQEFLEMGLDVSGSFVDEVKASQKKRGIDPTRRTASLLRRGPGTPRSAVRAWNMKCVLTWWQVRSRKQNEKSRQSSTRFPCSRTIIILEIRYHSPRVS
jgi:hypothetical protein